MTQWSFIFQAPADRSRVSISAHIDAASSLDDALDEANEALESANDDTLGVYIEDGFDRNDLVRIICHQCGAIIDRTDNEYRDLGFDSNTDGMVAWMEGQAGDGCSCEENDD